jgi:hypothetical protein
MVARGGNAPPSTGCKPAALLLSYRAKREERMAERQGIEPWTPTKVLLFSRQLPRPTGRAPRELAPQRGLAPRRPV